MIRHLFSIGLVIVALVVATGCGNQSGTDVAEGPGEAATQAQTPLCDAVEKLDVSLDALEDCESIDEFKSAYATVEQNYQAARAEGGEEYAAEFDAFDAALAEFEESLTSLDDEGLISGVLGLAADAAKLAAAGDELDDAIDC